VPLNHIRGFRNILIFTCAIKPTVFIFQEEYTERGKKEQIASKFENDKGSFEYKISLCYIEFLLLGYHVFKKQKE